ncbi:nitroreductase family protein [Nonomuraea sp. NPDC002799]
MSIRSPKQVLDAVVEAGRWAPSVHNTQPWTFAVSGEEISLRADTIRLRARRQRRLPHPGDGNGPAARLPAAGTLRGRAPPDDHEAGWSPSTPRTCPAVRCPTSWSEKDQGPSATGRKALNVSRPERCDEGTTRTVRQS